MKQPEFQEFYRASRDACLRSVLVTVGDRQLAEDLVAEAFTRAWGSWSTVSRHPAPSAWIVRTALSPSGDGSGVDKVMHGDRKADGTVELVFTPAAVPTGKELFIGYLSPAQLAVTKGRPGSVERLVTTGVPLTCTSQAPPARPASDPAGRRG